MFVTLFSNFWNRPILNFLLRFFSGTNHYYVFIHPVNLEMAQNSPKVVDWQYAQQEIAEQKGLVVKVGKETLSKGELNVLRQEQSNPPVHCGIFFRVIFAFMVNSSTILTSLDVCCVVVHASMCNLLKYTLSSCIPLSSLYCPAWTQNTADSPHNLFWKGAFSWS